MEGKCQSLMAGCWSVHHGSKVGGRPAQRGGSSEEAAALDRAQGGRRASPQVGRLGHRGRTGRLADWAGFHGRNSFRFKLNFRFLAKALENCTRSLGGIWAWGFFLNSSRLLKDFIKNTICMSCNAS
jgi:hypothetical protein